ncbi:MAG: hypothetical protein GX144_10760 [Clostridiaceae bacterium]|jgi:hypothetical protein|nr:hypothetical protein [Clostridiaceae bacterium]
MNYRDALDATRNRPAAFDRERNKTAVLGESRNICPQKKGTLLRIFIPAGAEINLLNLIEVSSPGGICIIVRLPFLEKHCGNQAVGDLLDSIKRAGGRFEFADC